MTVDALQWTRNNKLLIIFGLSTFCLFVSTVALSAQKGKLNSAKLCNKPTFDNVWNTTRDNFKEAEAIQNATFYRLSRHVVPKNYKLLLRPNTSNKTFDGSVIILIHVLERLNTITLHSNQLDISSTALKNNDNENITIKCTDIISDKRQLFNVVLHEEILKGYYELHIKFKGRLDKGIVGFYASSLKKSGLFTNLVKLKRNCAQLKSNYGSRNFGTNKTIMETSLNLTLSENLSPLVRPINYKLRLHPNLISGAFQGHVEISVDVKEPRNYLNIHSKFLEINEVNVYRDDMQISVTKFLEVKQLEQILIYFDNNLSAGNYQINIDFSGDMTQNIVGFYLSHLKNNGTMVASKFQPTYARQAFPCFDEPDFKATYDITLVKPVNYVALSNMNEVSRTHDRGTNTEAVTFATSVPMSTYLACFVICNFDFKETTINSNGIGKNFTLRSFAQKDQMHKIDFAQDIGKTATEFYIKYYEVPFPLPKLDMIAIPDYVSGATEHWGLITYRETSFLVDQTTASARNKISVANTIAHELAHMWFGNLVTMKWWDEVWLNEGFASYMQVKSLNSIEPSWTMLDQFLTKTLHPVLVTDAKLSSHPIVQTVSTPDEITAIFDAISYNKGASVLRMLEGFIGEETFRRGVSDYLKKHEFGNTVTQDLLSALEPYFKKDNPDLSITYIMDTWTRQMGYPLLTVKRSDQSNRYEVTQTRFLLDPEAIYDNDSQFNYRWFVPITYKTNKGSNQDILWFPNTSDKVKITLKESENWLKINNNQVGYYRVNYESDMWAHLIRQLQAKTDQLTISDRAHLLDDAFALAEARVVSYELALNLATYLVAEEDYVPWETAASVFSKLAQNLENTSASDHLEKFIQRLVKPLYDKQSWEKTEISIIDGLLRTRILALATRYQLPDAVAKVHDVFLNWLNKHGTPEAIDIEPELRDVIYNYGMKPAALKEWEKLWQIYLKEEDAQELAKLRLALAAPRDTDILKRYLTLAWDEKNIRSQDFLNVIQYIASNPKGTNLVWDEVRMQWPRLVDRFTLNSRYLGNVIPAITSSFNTEERLKEMQDWFARYPEAGAGETGRRRALENVRNNIKWTSIHQSTITEWLRAHN